MSGFAREEVEPILRTLGNDYTVEKGVDGIETIVVMGKEGNIVASFNDKETKFFDAEFQQEFMGVKENVKGLKEKVKYEKRKVNGRASIDNAGNENKNKNEKDEKEEEPKEIEGEITKEKIENELGDEYVVAAEVNDEEISRKLISTEGFIGNPLIAFNKETKEFVLVGNQGNGKLAEAELLRTATVVNVNKYNYDGSIVEEKSINGMIMLPPENNDGLDLRMNQYGEIEINKIVNARGDNPQMFPVDTKQKTPSTQEIDEMKKDGSGMEELMEIIDDMKAENIITAEEETEILEDLSTDGKTLDEDKAKLKAIKEQKANEKKGNGEFGDGDDDENDPRDPRANDPRWT